MVQAVRSGVVGTVVAAVVGVVFWLMGEKLTQLSYDLPFIFFVEKPVDEVLILRMDESTYQATGQQYPFWDRSRHARLPS